ncbi:MAG: ATP cone domain-containing protein, partial [Bdellovibrionota bacterium]
GRRETYDREKILGGVQKACQKRPVTTQAIEELVRRIERRIQSLGLKEIPARAIGQMLMQELHGLDKVAYVRFSSVYRDFQDVKEFVAELQEALPTPDEEALQAGQTLLPLSHNTNPTKNETASA